MSPSLQRRRSVDGLPFIVLHQVAAVDAAVIVHISAIVYCEVLVEV